MEPLLILQNIFLVFNILILLHQSHSTDQLLILLHILIVIIHIYHIIILLIFLYFYVIIHIAYILIFSFWFQGVSTASKLYFFTSFHSYCNSASSPSLILPLFLLLLLFCSSQFSLIFTNIHILYNSIYTLFYFTFNLCCSYCRTASSEDCERSEAGRWSWHTKQEAGGAGRALGPSEQQRSVTCEGVVKGDERMRRSTNAGRGGWGGGSTRAAPRRSRMRKS